MERGILLGMLALYGVEDLRKKTISARYLPLFAIAGMGLHLFLQNLSVVSILLGMAVGLGMMGLSVLTRGSIGMGDGMLLVVSGVFLGGAANVELLFTGLFYAAVFSLGILVLGKRKKHREIPFVPFLFLGYVTMVLTELLVGM